MTRRRPTNNEPDLAKSTIEAEIARSYNLVVGLELQRRGIIDRLGRERKRLRAMRTSVGTIRFTRLLKEAKRGLQAYPDVLVPHPSSIEGQTPTRTIRESIHAGEDTRLRAGDPDGGFESVYVGPPAYGSYRVVDQVRCDEPPG
jgi:hypothetical protein